MSSQYEGAIDARLLAEGTFYVFRMASRWVVMAQGPP